MLTLHLLTNEGLEYVWDQQIYVTLLEGAFLPTFAAAGNSGLEDTSTADEAEADGGDIGLDEGEQAATLDFASSEETKESGEEASPDGLLLEGEPEEDEPEPLELDESEKAMFAWCNR